MRRIILLTVFLTAFLLMTGIGSAHGVRFGFFFPPFVIGPPVVVSPPPGYYYALPVMMLLLHPIIILMSITIPAMITADCGCRATGKYSRPTGVGRGFMCQAIGSTVLKTLGTLMRK